MESRLRDIVQNRAEIKALLKDIPSDTQQKLPWISPHEIHLPQLSYEDIDDPDAINSLIQLHQEIFNNKKVNNQQNSKILVNFNHVDIPDSTPPRPSVSDVRSRIESGLLNIGVYSSDGYNFGLEYHHIYNGETLTETRYDDIIAILSRSVYAVDPTVNATTAKLFAEYMARMACWEVDYANLLTLRTIGTKFPKLPARVYENMNFYAPFIYIGLSEQSIPYFWIRICPAIESTNEDTGPLRELDRSYEKHTCFCYYHRYALTVQNCEELDIAGYADSSTGETSNTDVKKPPSGIIPPPPKKLNQVDIQIHLLLRNSAQSTDNQFDISVEINSDGENVIETAAAEHEDNNFFTSDQVYTPRNSNHVEKEISSSSKTTLISTISTMMTCDPTPFAEVVGWGRNTSYIFDPSRDKLNPIATSNSTSASDISDYICYHPTKLSIPPSINLERVAMIACSHRHVIVLTHNGSLYTCGDNTEGALGLGDTFSRHKLTLLLWPIGKDVNNNSNASDEQVEVQQTLETPENLIDKQLKKGNSYKRIVYIAAGSSDIGSHSMAIDEEGTLYGWGTPSATGHGKIQPVLSPLPVKLPLVDESVVGEAQAIQTTLASDKIMKVKHVACGGGFTVAVLSTGQVASWGMWAHGRLGLGAPPEAQINRGAGARRKKEQKKVVRYQLKPKVIPRLNNAIKVSCGESHTLCLTSSGKVYSWGQNSCGQLGIGPTPSGYLRDMLIPTRVHFLQSELERKERRKYLPNKENLEYLKVIDICCGTFHSLVTDINNCIWSWGGRGDVCLGHNDSQLSGIWAERCKSVFPTLSNANKLMVPYDLLDWCKTWSVPRLIKSLQFPSDLIPQSAIDKVIQLSAGDMHSSILYQSGRIYLCGNGPVVSPIQIKHEVDDEEGEGEEGEEGNEQKDKLNRTIDETINELEQNLITVTTPRCPSSLWYEKLSILHNFFSPSDSTLLGAYSIILQDEDMIVSTLTDKLLHHETNNSKLFLTSDVGHDNSTIISDTTNSTTTTAMKGLPSISRGKADCLLIAGGKVLAAHRALLANRCALIREKLIEEAPIDDGLPGSIFTPTQVLLPDLTIDPAKALHMYLYTDCLPPKCVKTLSTLQSLHRIARKLRIPRLIAICETFISIHKELSNTLYEEDNEDILDQDENNEEFIKTNPVFSSFLVDIPPSTVARDLGSLVGDSQYADIRFIAEGRTIAAHRFILETRCEYFRMMFSSGMAESTAVNEDSNGTTSSGMVDIVVPDSFIGLLRFLIYLYTNILPDGSDGALLEDLMSADRYQVESLKRLCESMLVPSQSNWLDLLRASHLFNCPQLEVSVMGYLRDNISELLKIGETQNISEEFPTLLADVMELRRIAYPTPPSQLLIDHTAFIKRKVEEKRNTIHLPWWSMIMALLLSFVYREVVTVVSLGPLVPIINISGLLGLVYYFYRTVLKE